jgi:hypothetical protein
MRLTLFLLLLACTTLPLPVVAEPPLVAGLKPAQRPVGAPTVVRFDQSAAWRAAALRGIREPQTGLGFLKDQGAWYTPFNQPNLPGRYDIRGLHAGQNKD